MIDDVMAHVHTFGLMAPEAAGIIQYEAIVGLDLSLKSAVLVLHRAT